MLNDGVFSEGFRGYSRRFFLCDLVDDEAVGGGVENLSEVATFVFLLQEGHKKRGDACSAPTQQSSILIDCLKPRNKTTRKIFCLLERAFVRKLNENSEA